MDLIEVVVSATALRLVAAAVWLLPRPLQERFGEEWQAHVLDTTRAFAKLDIAAGLLIASFKIGMTVALRALADRGDEARRAHISTMGHPAHRVGVLMTSIGPDDLLLQTLRYELRKLGHLGGKSIHFEYRNAHGQSHRLQQLANELVDLRVDAIVAGNECTARAAKRVTRTIPVVALFYASDPVATRLINSFDQPGGNVTGVFTSNTRLSTKSLELLRDAVPGLSRLAIFEDSFSVLERDEFMRAALALNIQSHRINLQSSYNFEAAFDVANRINADAVVVTGSPVFYANRARIASLALERHLPLMASWNPGALISYGADLCDAYLSLARCVDKLLKGANPSVLSVEKLTRFMLGVNLEAAKILGLAVPRSILPSVDEVVG